MADMEGNLDARNSLGPFSDNLLRQEELFLVQKKKKSLVDKLLLRVEYAQFCRTQDPPPPAPLERNCQNCHTSQTSLTWDWDLVPLLLSATAEH